MKETALEKVTKFVFFIAYINFAMMIVFVNQKKFTFILTFLLNYLSAYLLNDSASYIKRC